MLKSKIGIFWSENTLRLAEKFRENDPNKQGTYDLLKSFR